MIKGDRRQQKKKAPVELSTDEEHEKEVARRFTVSISAEVHDKLEAEMRRSGRRRSHIVEAALAAYLLEQQGGDSKA